MGCHGGVGEEDPAGRARHLSEALPSQPARRSPDPMWRLIRQQSITQKSPRQDHTSTSYHKSTCWEERGKWRRSLQDRDGAGDEFSCHHPFICFFTFILTTKVRPSSLSGSQKFLGLSFTITMPHSIFLLFINDFSASSTSM